MGCLEQLQCSVTVPVPSRMPGRGASAWWGVPEQDSVVLPLLARDCHQPHRDQQHLLQTPCLSPTPGGARGTQAGHHVGVQGHLRPWWSPERLQEQSQELSRPILSPRDDQPRVPGPPAQPFAVSGLAVPEATGPSKGLSARKLPGSCFPRDHGAMATLAASPRAGVTFVQHSLQTSEHYNIFIFHILEISCFEGGGTHGLIWGGKEQWDPQRSTQGCQGGAEGAVGLCRGRGDAQSPPGLVAGAGGGWKSPF